MTNNRIVAGLSIIALFLSCIVLSIQIEAKKVTHTVVEIHQVVLATDAQRVSIFIDELLTKRSAKCFKAILKVETTGYDSNAVNSKTGARGIGQLLESTYQNIGLKHSADPLAQVVASLAYISRHYGSGGTCAAWKSERTTNSY